MDSKQFHENLKQKIENLALIEAYSSDKNKTSLSVSSIELLYYNNQSQHHLVSPSHLMISNGWMEEAQIIVFMTQS